MKKRNYKGLIFSALATATLALGTGTTAVFAVEDTQTSENSSENSSTSQKTRQKNSTSDASTSEKTTNKTTKDSSTNSSKESTKDSTTSKDSTASDKSSTSKNKTNSTTSNNKTSSTTSEVNDEVVIADLTTVTDSKINLANATTNLLIEKAGTYTLTGDTNKTVVVDTNGDVTLVLDKANFTSEKLPSIYVRNATSTKIELKNTSTITNNGNDEILNAAVYVRSPLSLTGSGTLTVTDKNGHGIKAKDDMTSKDVTLNITAEEDGIHASDSFTIESGKYTITSGDEGIQANDNLIIKNGTFVINSEGDGLHGDGDVELDNGTYTINAQSEGIESKANLLIKNGTYTINAMDDGLNAATSLTIKDGKLTIVSSQNDGIDSNGTLTIDGGTVYATGLKTPEGAFDVDNTPFIINGGTIVGLSATATKPTDAAQNTIMINVTQAFSKLELKQGGKTVLTYNNDSTTKFNQATLTLSAKNIQADTETEIYLDGELYDSAFTTQQGLTTVGNIMTMGGGRGGMMGGMPRPGEDQDFGGNYAPNGDYDEDFFYGEFSRDNYRRGYDDGYYDGYAGEDYGYSYRGRGHQGYYEEDYDVYFGKDGDDYYLYEEDFYGRPDLNQNQDSSTSNGSNKSSQSNNAREDGSTSASQSLNNKKSTKNQTTQDKNSSTSSTENA